MLGEVTWTEAIPTHISPQRQFYVESSSNRNKGCMGSVASAASILDP